MNLILFKREEVHSNGECREAMITYLILKLYVIMRLGIALSFQLKVSFCRPICNDKVKISSSFNRIKKQMTIVF